MNVVLQYKERFRKEFLVKFDMHCHTKEGSLDGKVEIEEYIRILKEKGYQGMLVSDHNVSRYISCSFLYLFYVI